MQERSKFSKEGRRDRADECTVELATALHVSVEEAGADAPPIAVRSFEHGAPGPVVPPRGESGPVVFESAQIVALISLVDAVLRAQNPPSDDPLRGARHRLVLAIETAPRVPVDDGPRPCGIPRDHFVPDPEPWGFTSPNPRPQTAMKVRGGVADPVNG